MSDDPSSARLAELPSATSAADGPDLPKGRRPTAEALAEGENAETVETLGGDEFEEAEHQRSRTIRHYKIQEVIKRRQIMLVQVTKEERGNKGAALTTYLSLAGRYCVLMPNTARGGGVSRKITSISDRRRLKDILEELDIPEGMGVIVRTAGAERSKAEIKRDYEYLLRLWNEIRDMTLRSTAPALIYEEGNLIKRSIRDLYTRDIDEVAGRRRRRLPHGQGLHEDADAEPCQAACSPTATLRSASSTASRSRARSTRSIRRSSSSARAAMS